jgi:hypothetical protein
LAGSSVGKKFAGVAPSANPKGIASSSPAKNPNGIPTQSPGLRGTSYPGFTVRKSFPTATRLRPLAPALRDEWLSLAQKEWSWSAFEDLVKRTVNCLFTPQLGEARFQSRTEVDLGEERRDVIAHNKADTGFWKDLKDKFKSSEILFEAKYKTELKRDDLRQTYCYLKESLGYWGFLVFRGPKNESALAYNRTLYRNFGGSRGVLILNHEDFRKMLEIKIRNDDPTDYLRNLYSKFNQEV